MSAATAVELGRLWVQLKRVADQMTARQSDAFIRLPGLLAYWPMGIRGDNGNVAEHGGVGTALNEVGSCPVGYDGDAYTHLGDGTNYLEKTGFFNPTGTEAFIDASLNGFTLGGWFWADVAPTGTDGLISKDAPAPERGYALTMDGSLNFSARMSGTGAATVSATSAAHSIQAWHFVVARYIPSTEISVFVDGTKSTNTAAIPASQFVSSADFEIGRDNSADARIFHGRIRDAFLCQAQLSDEILEQLRLSTVPTV